MIKTIGFTAELDNLAAVSKPIEHSGSEDCVAEYVAQVSKPLFDVMITAAESWSLVIN